MLDQATDPSLTIHLVLDNGSSHTSKSTEKWLREHSRLQPHYTPAHASWLDQAEPFFSILTRRLLRRGEFTSRDDRTDKIEYFVNVYNRTTKPSDGPTTAAPSRPHNPSRTNAELHYWSAPVLRAALEGRALPARPEPVRLLPAARRSTRAVAPVAVLVVSLPVSLLTALVLLTAVPVRATVRSLDADGRYSSVVDCVEDAGPHACGCRSLLVERTEPKGETPAMWPEPGIVPGSSSSRLREDSGMSIGAPGEPSPAT
jgi:hypothetical protein